MQQARTSQRRSWVHLVIAIALISLFPIVCEACPTCKEGISDGPNHANMIRGYFWSIIFMMSMPFLIFGSLAVYFYSMARRNRANGSEPVTRESFNDLAR